MINSHVVYSNEFDNDDIVDVGQDSGEIRYDNWSFGFVVGFANAIETAYFDDYVSMTVVIFHACKHDDCLLARATEPQLLMTA
jgi:hypothetical protein